MLSSHHSLRNLLSKKKSKVEPLRGNASLDDLAFLVKRLSVQVDDLVEEKQRRNSVSIETVLSSSIPVVPPVPAIPATSLPAKSTLTRQNSISRYITPHPLESSIHTTIDPWASYVPQNYGALLQRLEDIESLQKCPNDCCASTGTVGSADGVPWPRPIEPFQPALGTEKDWQEYLDIQYTHWCTLMRCLPLMDPVTSAHVKTVGLYAMREILKYKASQKREFDSYMSESTTTAAAATTSTILRDSMNCLNLPEKSIVPSVPQTAWMSSLETRTAIDSLDGGPIPPPKEANTPTPSVQQHYHSRFQRWVRYKKQSKKSHTDTANTPIHQSQTLRKIGSWFF